MSDNTKPPSSPRPGKIIGIVALSALLGFAAVYVTLGPSDNVGPVGELRNLSDKIAGEIAKTGETDKKSGDLAAFVEKSPPAPIPEISFQDGSGASKSLADFQGKVILLNLWATWCAPCKAEMPSLDRLQAQLGSNEFEVVALAVDRKGPEAAQKFLDDTSSTHLKLYIDETARSGITLKSPGLPATFLIDRQGRELGRLVGPAEWDSPAAIKLVKTAIAAKD